MVDGAIVASLRYFEARTNLPLIAGDVPERARRVKVQWVCCQRSMGGVTSAGRRGGGAEQRRVSASSRVSSKVVVVVVVVACFGSWCACVCERTPQLQRHTLLSRPQRRRQARPRQVNVDLSLSLSLFVFLLLSLLSSQPLLLLLFRLLLFLLRCTACRPVLYSMSTRH